MKLRIHSQTSMLKRSLGMKRKFTPHFIMNVITYPCLDLSYSMLIKWALAVVIQYIPRNMHTVFALLCFVVVIHWLIFPYPSGLLHWHCGNLTIAPVPAKQPWWIWINTSCEFIMNDCITTTKQSTTKPCAYFLGYTVTQIGFKSASSDVEDVEDVEEAILNVASRRSGKSTICSTACLSW